MVVLFTTSAGSLFQNEVLAMAGVETFCFQFPFTGSNFVTKCKKIPVIYAFISLGVLNVDINWCASPNADLFSAFICSLHFFT